MKKELPELVKDIATLSAQLDRLLDDPHPGLYSWRAMWRARLQQLLIANQALLDFLEASE